MFVLYEEIKQFKTIDGARIKMRKASYIFETFLKKNSPKFQPLNEMEIKKVRMYLAKANIMQMSSTIEISENIFDGILNEALEKLENIFLEFKASNFYSACCLIQSEQENYKFLDEQPKEGKDKKEEEEFCYESLEHYSFPPKIY